MTAPQTTAAVQEGDTLPAAVHHPDDCPGCGGDGFTFHLSPTNGAIEIDGLCTEGSPR